MTTTRDAFPAAETDFAAPRVRSIDITGPAGRLEAILNEGRADSPFAAVLCHPHPLGGGTMHNKVVYHAMKALNAPEWGLGWPVLRFNFRGTGLSEGVHDGVAEFGDVLAALAWLEAQYTLPTVLAGFSFGAAMGLTAACSERNSGLRALAALGLPTHASGRDYDYGFLKDCDLPKLFLSGDQDQFAPVSELQRVVNSAAEPSTLVLVPGADHFFTGQLASVQSALSTWLKERLL